MRELTIEELNNVSGGHGDHIPQFPGLPDVSNEFFHHFYLHPRPINYIDSPMSVYEVLNLNDVIVQTPLVTL